MDTLCYLCLLFAMRLFIAALRSPAGECLIVFLSLSMWYPGSGVMQYLIGSIPDLCRLSYLEE